MDEFALVILIIGLFLKSWIILRKGIRMRLIILNVILAKHILIFCLVLTESGRYYLLLAITIPIGSLK